MAKAIGTLGNIDTITIGERVLTDLSNLIVLYSENLAAGGSFTFKRVSTGAAYAPSGVTFLPKVVRLVNPDASARGISVGYSDNSVGFSSGTALTNPVRVGGMGQGSGILAPIASTTHQDISTFVVPAGKFVSGEAGSSGQSTRHWIWGYEA